MGTFIAIIIIGLIGFIVFMVIDGNYEIEKYSKKIDEVRNKLNSIDDFDPEIELFGKIDKGFMISHDIKRKKICFINKEFRCFIYNYSDIINCELQLDGKTIQKHSSSSTIGRAIIGGAIAGGAGAIIGGTTGKVKNEKKVNSIDLKIIMNDINNPVYKINCLSGSFNSDELIVKQIMERAEKWHGVISAMIYQSKEIESKSINDKSILPELEKLKSLFDSGVLTQNEFEILKKKII